jgi:hypothetical protein
MALRSLSLLCLAALVSQSAYGWGAEGHRIIAAIAAKHLNVKARAAVQSLLEPGETLESVSTWADEIRQARPETSTWHYINLPAQASGAAWSAYCPKEGCIAGAALAMRDKLAAQDLDRKERAEALKFFVHFISDLHQPLHAGNPEDRGGNDIQVIFLDRPTNLHSLWDSGILRAIFERDPARREKLSRKLGYFERRGLAKGNLEQWLWESRAAATAFCYAGVPAQRPAQLDDDYFRKAAPALEKQIRRAAARLARELNAALSN